MKTSELIGPTLDWAVAKCEGGNPTWLEDLEMFANCRDCGSWNYSTNWSQGGPIIEQNQLAIDYDCAEGGRWWAAHMATDTHECGPTLLIAAMRCYVASKLGDEVDVSAELVK